MRGASPLALALATLALAGCATRAPDNDPARTALLKDTYDHLHARLEKAAATEPLVASALADHGHVVLAMRARLIEELAGNVAQRSSKAAWPDGALPAQWTAARGPGGTA